jgi:TPR repeat protein
MKNFLLLLIFINSIAAQTLDELKRKARLDDNDLKRMEILAQEDHAALFYLANILRHGNRCPQNSSKAIELYTKLETENSLLAVADMYARGAMDLEKDTDLSLEFYAKASKKGTYGMTRYAMALAPKDRIKALMVMGEAAKKNGMAAYKMGIYYQYGQLGVKRDPEKAANYFKKAISLNEQPAAYYELAIC